MSEMIRTARANRWDRLVSVLLGTAILLLPITSLPILARAMDNSILAPPSMLPIFLVAVILLPQFLVHHERLPRETLPWLAFCVSAVISCLFAYFRPIPAFRSFTIPGAEASALLTLAVGAMFYLAFVVWFQKEGRLTWAFRLISIGGVVILIWSFVQLFFMKFRGAEYPGLMVKFQGLLSLRSLLDHTFYDRIAGLAFEPSWLAHQLNMLYLPLWLAASLTGLTSFPRLGRLTVENILLAGGVVVLFFSQSRVGLLAFLLALAYLVYMLHLRLVNRLLKRRPAGFSSTALRAGVLILLFMGYMLLAAALILVLARIDRRFAALLSLSSIPTSLLGFASQVDFATRVIYWLNGWVLFARFPLFGAGLGNAGFFLKDNLPVIAYRMTEVTQVLNLYNYLPNVKSFWPRILGETGLAGFSLFVSWLYLLWHAARFMRTRASIQLRTAGWMAVLVIIVFLAEGFSVDSFAMPYLWVSLGLATAASALARRERVELDPEG